MKQPRCTVERMLPVVNVFNDRDRFTMTALARRLGETQANTRNWFMLSGITAFDAQRAARVIDRWAEDLRWVAQELRTIALETGEIPIPESEGIPTMTRSPVTSSVTPTTP